MPYVRSRCATALLLVLAAGCGGDGSGAGQDAFAHSASAVSASSDQHRRNMAGAPPSGCAAEMARYGAEIRPMLEHMRQLGGEMDACMAAMGHAAEADLQATCDAMRASVDDHLAHGCAAADPAAAAAQHAEAMRAMADHELARAGMAGPMMGSGRMGGGCGH
jgi:hypothetical protein